MLKPEGVGGEISNNKARHYITLASEANQPYCLMYQASWLKRQGLEVEARAMHLKATKLGNNSEQVFFISDYLWGRSKTKIDIGKAFCWFEIAQRPEFYTGEVETKQVELNRAIREEKEKGINTYTKYDPDSWCETELGEEKLPVIKGINR